VLGADRRLQRSSDDGEPGGTAGQPILDVINGRGLSDVAVVVTRYFGGTLLGAGGLVRAYSEAGAVALDAIRVVRRERLDLVSFDVAHDTVGKVESSLRNQGFAIERVVYADVATVTLATSDVEGLRTTTAQLVGSAVALEPRGEVWIDRPL
jgi:putative IMPACT (imprinted ancient) family translation regulator